MKIHELIDILKTKPQNHEIWVRTVDGDATVALPVRDVTVAYGMGTNSTEVTVIKGERIE